MDREEREYLILKSIKDGQDTIRQRDIAKIAGISLGSANTIVKRLIDKGLIKTKQTTSKHIKYLLTPAGLTLITKIGGDFLKRTIRNVVVFNESIDIIVKEIKAEGYTTINLIGESDLLFIIQHSCNINGIVLQQTEDKSTNSKLKNIDAAELGQEVLDSYLFGAVLH